MPELVASAHEAWKNVWRDEAPHVLAALLRRHRDLADCEDAVQLALLAAAEKWPRDGLPTIPRAWLHRVASRRLVDIIRADASRRDREERAARLEVPDPDAQDLPGCSSASTRPRRSRSASRSRPPRCRDRRPVSICWPGALSRATAARRSPGTSWPGWAGMPRRGTRSCSRGYAQPPRAALPAGSRRPRPRPRPRLRHRHRHRHRGRTTS